MKKKKLFGALLLSAVLVPTTMAVVGCGPTLGLQGEGTAANPYLITSVEEFNKLTQATDTGLIKDKVFKLTTDIGDAQNPYTTDLTKFKATFDGVLIGEKSGGAAPVITMEGPTALFAVNEGEISNINIVGEVDANTQTGAVGMLANTNKGEISDVTTSGSITSERGVVSDLTSAEANGIGAIVGLNDTTGVIEDVANKATVKAKVGAGGIAAINKGTIQTVANTGAIGMTEPTSTADWLDNTKQFSVMGGVAGVNFGDILSATNKADVFAAGLDKSEIANFDEATYKGNQYIGGIAGYNEVGGLISNTSTNYGSSYVIFGDKYVGGISGYNKGVIEYSLARETLGARINFGGITSYNDGTNAKVKNSAVGANKKLATGLAALGDPTACEAVGYYFVANTAENCAYNAADGRGFAPATGYTDCVTGYSDDPSDVATLYKTLNKGLTVGQEKWFVSEGTSSASPVIQPVCNITDSMLVVTGEGTTTFGTLYGVSSFITSANKTKLTNGELTFTPDATINVPTDKEFKGWSTDGTAANIIMNTDDPDTTDVDESLTIKTVWNFNELPAAPVYAVYADVPVQE